MGNRCLRILFSLLIALVLSAIIACGKPVETRSTPQVMPSTTYTVQPEVRPSPHDDNLTPPAGLANTFESPIKNEQDVVDYIGQVKQGLESSWTPWMTSRGFPAPIAAVIVATANQPPVNSCAGPLDTNAENAFYCADNRTVYLTAGALLALRSGKAYGHLLVSTPTGRFAIALVYAHEYGHHIQDLLYRARVQQSQIEYQQSNGQIPVLIPPANPDIELVADCFAGVWANMLNGQVGLYPGGIEDARSVLDVIGDDMGSHGTGLERVSAFNRGLHGKPHDCVRYYWGAFLRYLPAS